MRRHKFKTRKSPALAGLFRLSSSLCGSALLVLGVTRAELVDSTRGVHQGVLSCKEGVARRAHFHLDDRVLIAVLPLLGVLALSTTLSEETPIGGEILKNNSAVVIGVNSFFHRTGYGAQKYNALRNRTTSGFLQRNFPLPSAKHPKIGHNEQSALDKIKPERAHHSVPCDGFK